jgi:hypothetical protein
MIFLAEPVDTGHIKSQEILRHFIYIYIVSARTPKISGASLTCRALDVEVVDLVARRATIVPRRPHHSAWHAAQRPSSTTSVRSCAWCRALRTPPWTAACMRQVLAAILLLPFLALLAACTTSQQHEGKVRTSCHGP